MKKLTLLILLSIIFYSCKKENNTCVYAYFGGEIVNPNSKYVTLTRPNGIKDSLLLDENNRFFKKIEDLQSGIYRMVHGGENQLLLLEPQDSLLVRLNTLEFDESLVFTGKGSKKNNYLIELYLESEKENQRNVKLSKLDASAFSKNLDEKRKDKLNEFSFFCKKNKTSSLFEKIGKATINYNFYANLESYPFTHFGNANVIKQSETLPKDFHNYRNEISYSDDDLKIIYPYTKFLNIHINNLALKNYYKTTKDTILNRRSLAFNLERMRLMDSLITNESIKNKLLKYSIISFINLSKDYDDRSKMLNAYLNYSTSDDDKKHTSKLVNSLNNLKPGSSIPNIKLVNTNEQIVSLKKLVNKPTVIAFWDVGMKSHFQDNHERIYKLRERYPDINFIFINISATNYNVWKRILLSNKFSLANEYKFVNSIEARQALALIYINKIILMNDKGQIVDANANMFSLNFEEKLNNLVQEKSLL